MSTSLLLAIASAAGVAAGVFLEPSTTVYAPWLVAAFTLASFLMAARGRPYLARWGIAGAFLPMCVVIGSAAEQRAMHPPLRQYLEHRVGGFAIESRDVERHETPVEIEGRLIADASPTEAGASLRVRVEHVSAGACLEAAEGGVSLTVLGAMTGEAIGAWRAGRTIRATAVLRRPAALNEGVPT